MKTRYLLLLVFVAMLMLAIVPQKGEASTHNQQQGLIVTKKDGVDLSAFSEKQCQLFGSLVGEFVLDCFRGKEDLRLPEGLQELYVDNDEMYYVMRRQQYLIDAIGVTGGGRIHALNHLETVLWDIQELSVDRVQLTAYVKLAFRYADDPEQRQAGVGQEVIVTLIKTGEGRYLIENFIEYSAEYDMMKSDYQAFCRETEQKDAAAPRELMDLYFVGRLSQLSTAKKLEKDDEKQVNIVEENADSSGEPSSLNRLSVSYNRTSAATYANIVGSMTDLIFHRIPSANGYDCTNFVSQAVWVGYDGDKGDFFNWLNLYPNATYLQNCKLWAYQMNRQISGDPGWYGASKYVSQQLPSGPWMRVWQSWSYISTSSSGPRAYKYNYGLLYSASSLVIQAGDILQFSTDPSSGYGHSVMVVNDAYQTLSGHTSIYVAQHSGDYGWRQLTDVINSAGEYVRIIRPISGSFTQ